MLKIKLARFGKKNQPHFRIVVTEARSKRDGKYVALLGQYVPSQEPKVLNLDLEAYNDWIKKGAQPTDTVASLAKRAESGNPFPEKPKKLSKKAKAKLEAEKEAKAQAETEATEAKEVAPEVTETATEETASEAEAQTEATSEESAESAE